MNKPLGILRFNLEDPYQARDFESSFKGPRLKDAIDSIYDEVFRPTLKYDADISGNGEQVGAYEIVVVQKVWDRLYNHLKEAGCFYGDE